MAGYSKTPLIKKLGIKEGSRALFLEMPEAVRARLAPLPEGIGLAKAGDADLDYIHYFARQAADFEKKLPMLKHSLHKEGALWISWRKGRINTDLTETIIRRLALAAGLVDVKVCAVDETWSALKLVYRVRDRGR